MEKVCAFFGHREVWEDISKPLEAAIRSAAMRGFTLFWCGQQGMFDSLAANTVKRLKAEFPQIRLAAVLAYLSCRLETAELFDETIYPEGLERIPQKFAILRRNQWMITNADAAIFYVNRGYGGAHAVLRTAQKQQKVLVNLGSYAEAVSRG